MGYEKIASLDTDTVYALGGTDEKNREDIPEKHRRLLLRPTRSRVRHGY